LRLCSSLAFLVSPSVRYGHARRRSSLDGTRGPRAHRSSAARRRRGAKRRLYQRHVPEYWIVDLDAELIERWRSGEDRPDIATSVFEWQPPGATEPLRLELDKFFDRIGRNG
jgi:hypothetical protein